LQFRRTFVRAVASKILGRIGNPWLPILAVVGHLLATEIVDDSAVSDEAAVDTKHLALSFLLPPPSFTRPKSTFHDASGLALDAKQSCAFGKDVVLSGLRWLSRLSPGERTPCWAW